MIVQSIEISIIIKTFIHWVRVEKHFDTPLDRPSGNSFSLCLNKGAIPFKTIALKCIIIIPYGYLRKKYIIVNMNQIYFHFLSAFVYIKIVKFLLCVGETSIFTVLSLKAVAYWCLSIWQDPSKYKIGSISVTGGFPVTSL